LGLPRHVRPGRPKERAFYKGIGMGASPKTGLLLGFNLPGGRF
jgi:hypothetical protein